MAWFPRMSGLLPSLVLVLVALTGKTSNKVHGRARQGWLACSPPPPPPPPRLRFLPPQKWPSRGLLFCIRLDICV